MKKQLKHYGRGTLAEVLAYNEKKLTEAIRNYKSYRSWGCAEMIRLYANNLSVLKKMEEKEYMVK